MRQILTCQLVLWPIGWSDDRAGFHVWLASANGRPIPVSIHRSANFVRASGPAKAFLVSLECGVPKEDVPQKGVAANRCTRISGLGASTALHPRGHRLAKCCWRPTVQRALLHSDGTRMAGSLVARRLFLNVIAPKWMLPFHVPPAPKGNQASKQDTQHRHA